MGRFSAMNLSVGVLIASGALTPADEAVEEIVVKPDPPKQRRSAPEDQPQIPVSRPHPAQWMATR